MWDASSICLAGRDGVYVSSVASCYPQKRADSHFRSPTAGGQYHFKFFSREPDQTRQGANDIVGVSEFAPPKVQKLLSYLVGWYVSIIELLSCTMYLADDECAGYAPLVGKSISQACASWSAGLSRA